MTENGSGDVTGVDRENNGEMRGGYRRQGLLLGGMVGLALGTAAAATGFVLTYREALPLLLVAPGLGLLAGARTGHLVGYRGSRLAVYTLVLAAALPLLSILPYEVQAHRFGRLRDAYVPEYPEATIVHAAVNVLPESGYPGFMTMYGTHSDPVEVLDYMRARLLELGWREMQPGTNPLNVVFRFERPGYRLHLQTHASGGYVVDVVAFNLVFNREGLS